MKWLPMLFIGAILPLIYTTVLTVLGIIQTQTTFSEDLKTLVITAVISGTLSGITGYAIGSSNGSARKDEKQETK